MGALVVFLNFLYSAYNTREKHIRIYTYDPHAATLNTRRIIQCHTLCTATRRTPALWRGRGIFVFCPKYKAYNITIRIPNAFCSGMYFSNIENFRFPAPSELRLLPVKRNRVHYPFIQKSISTDISHVFAPSTVLHRTHTRVAVIQRTLKTDFTVLFVMTSARK